MKNIKRCTSPIKLPFLVFQNLTLNFGALKSILSILSHRLEVAICGVRGGRAP